VGNKPLGHSIRSLVALLGLALVGVIAPAAESRAQTRLQTASPQNAQLVTDSAELSRRTRDLQAGFERRRRYLLPTFYTGIADRCLIVGRFCEWHPNIQEDVVPEEGKAIRLARAELLRALAKASATLPGDDWIVGQRIRYLTETHDSAAIGVARTCRASKWWCEALLGLALHVNGDFAAADSAYSSALEDMPALMRCHWTNLSPLLDDDIRGTYRKMPCDQRDSVNGRIWWVADPLFMTQGNERRTEHFSRMVHTALWKDAANTYGTSWGGDLAELMLRFGWAEKWTQQPVTSSYSQAQPSVTGHEREPGFHFFLTQRPPDSLAQIVDSLFDVYQFPPREQYAPPYARSLVRLDAQVARFRRGDSTRIVAAFDVSADTVFGTRKFAAALVAMGDELATPARVDLAESPAKSVLTVMTPWKSQLIGVELLARDSAGAARWRSGFAEIPLDSNRISVSDLLFVDGVTSLPADLSEAIGRTHGGTKFRRDTKI
jgi:hypothetical protein